MKVADEIIMNFKEKHGFSTVREAYVALGYNPKSELSGYKSIVKRIERYELGKDDLVEKSIKGIYTERAKRKCLRCDTVFLSKSPVNRMCPYCRTKE